jgi:hypothetical protein
MHNPTIEGFGSSKPDLCLPIDAGHRYIRLNIKLRNPIDSREGFPLGQAYYRKTRRSWPIACQGALRGGSSENQSETAQHQRFGRKLQFEELRFGVSKLNIACTANRLTTRPKRNWGIRIDIYDARGL